MEPSLFCKYSPTHTGLFCQKRPKQLMEPGLLWNRAPYTQAFFPESNLIIHGARSVLKKSPPREWVFSKRALHIHESSPKESYTYMRVLQKSPSRTCVFSKTALHVHTSFPKEPHTYVCLFKKSRSHTWVFSKRALHVYVSSEKKRVLPIYGFRVLLQVSSTPTDFFPKENYTHRCFL